MFLLQYWIFLLGRHLLAGLLPQAILTKLSIGMCLLVADHSICS